LVPLLSAASTQRAHLVVVLHPPKWLGHAHGGAWSIVRGGEHGEGGNGMDENVRGHSPQKAWVYASPSMLDAEAQRRLLAIAHRS
jgi:hypothetical protein